MRLNGVEMYVRASKLEAGQGQGDHGTVGGTAVVDSERFGTEFNDYATW
jgi:hypothetical protein